MSEINEGKSKEKIKIVLTGGGTGGHVFPHLALLEFYKKNNWQLSYIGAEKIEESIIGDAGIPFYKIAAGKLRRYFSFKNFSDLFRIFFGCLQAFFILLKLRPHLVFSKGGFVSVPVCIAAWFLRIPVVTHESDFSPGLATRIIANFCDLVLCAFEETSKYIKDQNKLRVVGQPLRTDLMQGDMFRGLELCGFSREDKKPILLVIGGSQGSQKINAVVREALPELLKDFRVVHITGDKSMTLEKKGYKSFSFLHAELRDIFAIAELVVSRAGANSIFEFLMLKKPMLLIPLEQGSRGDQVQNANYFEKKSWARVLLEKNLNHVSLRASILQVADEKASIKAAQSQAHPEQTNALIFEILREIAMNRK